MLPESPRLHQPLSQIEIMKEVDGILRRYMVNENRRKILLTQKTFEIEL